MHEVEAPAVLDRKRDGGAVLVEVGDVAGDGVAAGLVRDRPGARGVDVGRHDERPLRRERAGGRTAEAARRAGDERHLVREPAHRAIASARSASPAIASPNDVR